MRALQITPEMQDLRLEHPTFCAGAVLPLADCLAVLRMLLATATATLLPLAAAGATTPPPKLSLGGLAVALDASLPRAKSFGFEGHTFPGGAWTAADADTASPLAAVATLATPCASTKIYCPQLADCFQGCADDHEAPHCYQSSCCPSKSFGAYNISSLGFYECRSTPCLANCTAIFAKGLPPVSPPPPVPPTPAPAPADGVTLVQVGGWRRFFSASSLTTAWVTASNGSSASWRLALGTTAVATGAVHLIAESDGHGSPAFHWSLETLTDHNTPAVVNQTRWVELGFGFASVSEAGAGYTTQVCYSGKRPVVTGPTGPNYKDWSWRCGARDGTITSTQAGSTSLGVGHYSGGWSADGTVGWGAWSSQRSAVAAIEGRLNNGTFTAGISRIGE